MATTKLYLDKRSARADGTYPIKLSVSHNKKTALLPLDIYVKAGDWDEKKLQVLHVADRKHINDFLIGRKVDADRYIRDFIPEAGRMSATELKNKIHEHWHPEKVKVYTFMDHFRQFTARKENKRTREIYEATMNAMQKFDKRLEQRLFEDINKRWLDNFFSFMAEKSPSVNARNIHLRNIRAVFNDAIDDELTACYPFRKVKIKPVATRKRSLDVEVLRGILTREVPGYMQRYQDALKLIVMLIGINTIDLLTLPQDCIVGDRLEFIRAKSHRPYSIKIEPEAREIMEKYRGREYYLDFAFIGCKNYRHFANRLNLHLKDLHPGLTTYWARHSWATIASNLDIPKETIAAALGHGGNSVTDIYIDFDQKKVDEANRKVIDWIMYGKK